MKRIWLGLLWCAAQWQKRPKGQQYRGGFSWQHDRVYAMLRQLQPRARRAIPARCLRRLHASVGAVTQTEQGIEITVAPSQRDEVDTVIALELDQPAGAVSPVAVP